MNISSYLCPRRGLSRSHLSPRWKKTASQFHSSALRFFVFLLFCFSCGDGYLLNSENAVTHNSSGVSLFNILFEQAFFRLSPLPPSTVHSISKSNILIMTMRMIMMRMRMMMMTMRMRMMTMTMMMMTTKLKSRYLAMMIRMMTVILQFFEARLLSFHLSVVNSTQQWARHSAMFLSLKNVCVSHNLGMIV